tara:strand:+ start:11666 stop:12301 length:636 start_codon:yes stop_codon:yes gene_type:complete
VKNLLTLFLVLLLTACSSTQYESAELIKNIDNAKLNAVKIYISSDGVILASQANERLFKLHHNTAEVQEMFENMAKRFGFQITNEEQAAYRLSVLDVKPDGGACVHGLSSFNKGFTFTLSIITLGVLPATNGYCIQINAELFYRPEVYGELSADMSPLSLFDTNKGRIDVLAGANEVNNYQRVVTIEDEARALETSIAHLFENMIQQGAFE